MSKDKQLIVILYGNYATADRPDQGDTLEQVKEIEPVLKELGYQTHRLAIEGDAREVINTLSQLQPYCVFNLVESFAGSDGNIYQVTALLDFLNIPYTGSSTSAFVMTANKIQAKKFLEAHAVASPSAFTMDMVMQRRTPLKSTYIIKSLTEHGSLGIDASSVVVGQEAILELMQKKKAHYGGEWIAERYIAGRELQVALLAGPDNPQVLPVSEAIFSLPDEEPPIVDFLAKWDAGHERYKAITRSFDFSKGDAALLRRVTHIALKCWEIFSLGGYARFDFRVDEDDGVWIVDINLNPCLSLDAGFMVAAGERGITPVKVIDRIVKACI